MDEKIAPVSNLDDTLDLMQAAAMLKISLATAQEMARAGELPGCKIGHSWVFLRDALRRYLWEQTEAQQRERRAQSGIDQKIAEGIPHTTRHQRRKKGEMASILRNLSPHATS